MGFGPRQRFLLVLPAFCAGLCASAHAALDLKPLSALVPARELLPPGFEAPAPPASVEGRAVSRARRVGAAALAAKTTVDLKPILNKHWLTTTSFTYRGTKVYLAGQLDMAGDGYVAVSGASWALPRLFKIERGMYGRFCVDKSTFNVTLSVSIFRPRLANRIQIREEQSQALVYDRAIGDFFNDTYWAGKDVVIAGLHYRLFYSYLVDPAKSAFDRSRFGFCLVYDEETDGYHEYYFYMIAQADIDGPSPVVYELYGGQQVGFRVDPAASTLEISR